MTEEKMNKAIELSGKISMLSDVHNALQDEDNLIAYNHRKEYYMTINKYLSPEEMKDINGRIKGLILAKLDDCKKEFEAL